VDRPDGGCPAERPTGIQRSGVVAAADRARMPAVASVAGPRPAGVSTEPVSSSGIRRSGPSSVQPVRCPAAWVRRPGSDGRAVRYPPSPHPSGVRPSNVQTAGVRPSGVRRPSGRVRLLLCQAVAVEPRSIRPGHPAPRERVKSPWAVAPSSGWVDGRGLDAGDAAQLARRRVGSAADPGRVGSGPAALARRPGRPGRRAQPRGWRLRCSAGAGGGAGLPHRPRGWRPGLGGRPRWVVVAAAAAGVDGPARATGRAGGDGRAAPARPRLAAGAPGALLTAL
jgi:hypothetical protein